MTIGSLYQLPSKRLAILLHQTESEYTFKYNDSEGGHVGLVPSFASRECYRVNAY